MAGCRLSVGSVSAVAAVAMFVILAAMMPSSSSSSKPMSAAERHGADNKLHAAGSFVAEPASHHRSQADDKISTIAAKTAEFGGLDSPLYEQRRAGEHRAAEHKVDAAVPAAAAPAEAAVPAAGASLPSRRK